MSRGRIRSIKPEFAYDGKIRRLSDSCALFFILFWTQCDDEGKHLNDPFEISSKLGGRWKQEKVKIFISLLSAQGQLRVSSCSAWVQVVHWSHQRINRPIQPKVRTEEIQWVDAQQITESSQQFVDETAHGSDRIGSDLKNPLPLTRTQPAKSGAGDFDFLLEEPETESKPPPPAPVFEPLNLPPTPKPPSTMMQSPENAAAAVIYATEHFGSGSKDRAALEAYLGPRLWKIATNIPGGLNAIRTMDRNNTFRHKLVTGMLKDTAERLGMEVK